MPLRYRTRYWQLATARETSHRTPSTVRCLVYYNKLARATVKSVACLVRYIMVIVTRFFFALTIWIPSCTPFVLAAKQPLAFVSNRKSSCSFRMRYAKPEDDDLEEQARFARMAELEDMGGDPFFLIEDDVNVVDAIAQDDTQISNGDEAANASDSGVVDGKGKTEKRYATDGKGPSRPLFGDGESTDVPMGEWDGTVDESAHFD